MKNSGNYRKKTTLLILKISVLLFVVLFSTSLKKIHAQSPCEWYQTTSNPVCENFNSLVATENIGGADDWYMPSRDELALVYTNLKEEGISTWDDDYYWTSSENTGSGTYDHYFAWMIDFETGVQTSAYWTKDHVSPTRPIRDFTYEDKWDIGDIGPAGGWIFHKVSLGGGQYKYYEAAKEDKLGRWSDNSWGNFINIPGADGTAVGTGYQNTQDMMAEFSSSIAYSCNNYVSDPWASYWYPSEWDVNTTLFNGVWDNHTPPNDFTQFIYYPTVSGTIYYLGSDGCELTYDVTVVSPPDKPSSITATPNPVCTGEDVTITLGGDDPSYTVYWKRNGSLLSSHDNPMTINEATAGTYTYEGKFYVGGCSSDYISVDVVVEPSISLVAPFGELEETVCEGCVLNFSGEIAGGIPPYEHSFIEEDYWDYNQTVIHTETTSSTSASYNHTVNVPPPPDDEGELWYYYEASSVNNSCGTMQTDIARIEVVPDLRMSAQSSTNVNSCSGETVIMWVEVQGGGVTGSYPPYNYDLVNFQWQSRPAGSSTWNDVAEYSDSYFAHPTSDYEYRCVITSDLCGCGPVYSSTFNVNILPEPVAPTSVTASELMICGGSSTNLQYSGGSGDVFIWHTGSCGGTQIGAGNNLTVAPSSTTTYYGAWENSCGLSACKTVTVTSYPNFDAGAINTTNQTICYGGNPGVLGSATNASGGDGNITYQWRADGVAIAGSNSATYDPPAGLTSTTTYTRWAKDGSCNTSWTQSTGSVIVSIRPEFTAGAIYTTGQTICYGGNPGNIGSATAASGGDGNISYQWRANGTAIAGANSATYNPPAGLTTTTTYTRWAHDGTCNTGWEQSTGSWVVTVYDDFSAGAINTTGQTICNGSNPGVIGNSTAASGGDGNIIYQWRANGSAIAGSNSATYDPPALTSTTTYTRWAHDGTCNTGWEQSAGTWVVTVQDVVKAGTIGTDHTICASSLANQITNNAIGTGSGTITYRWEQSITGPASGFATIAGETGSTYDPGILGTTHWYRRYTVSTQNGVVCESIATNVVKVTVQDPVTPGTIAADQTICYNTVPAPITSSVNGTGSGAISYIWERSTAGIGGPYTMIPGANNASYSPGNLTQTTWYRRTTVSNLNSVDCYSGTSNTIKITVQSVPTAGLIGADQAICSQFTPAPLTNLTAGTGDGAITYRWETETSTAPGYTTIAGENTDGYAPPELDAPGFVNKYYYYQRITVSTLNGTACESAATTPVEITVYPLPSMPVVNDNDVVICEATDHTITATSTIADHINVYHVDAFGTPLGTTPFTMTLGEDTTFYVEAVSQHGCIHDGARVVVDVTNKIHIDTTLTHVSCFGGADGEIATFPDGGVGTYYYSWSNGATASEVTGLVADTYDLELYDDDGCYRTGHYTINQPEEILYTANITESDCNTANGSIALTGLTGGTPPYEYLWSTGATTASITNLFADTYTVTVFDQNGCEKVEIYELSDVNGPDLTNTVITEITCHQAATGAIELNPMGGTAPYAYNWSTGSGSSQLSGLSAGSYSVTVSDATGCKSLITYNLDEPDALEIQATLVEPECGMTNGNIVTNVTGGYMGSGASVDYLWNTADITPNLTNITAGLYDLTITDTYGCQAIENFALSNSNGPNLNAVVNNESCFGSADGSIILNPTDGSGNYQYLWSTGASSASITGLNVGNYDVELTDINTTCLTYGTFEITSPPELYIASADITAPDCGTANGAISIIATGGSYNYTYQWTSLDGHTVDPDNVRDITGLFSGNYSVTVTDDRGCNYEALYAVSDNTGINLNETIVNPSCNGLSDGSIQVNPSDGVPPYSYEWNTGETSALISGLSDGVYSLTVTDGGGCFTVDNFTITEPNEINLNADITQTTCGDINGAISLNASGGSGAFNYLWDTGATTATISNLSAGTYTVTVNDDRGCEAIESFTIYDSDNIALTENANNVSCFGLSDASIEVLVSNGTAPYNYAWNNGASSNNIEGLTVGSYEVTVTDANGCMVSETYDITEPSEIEISLINALDSDCGTNTGSLEILATGGSSSFVSYDWSSGHSGSSINGLIAGVYTVTVVDDNGCQNTETFSISDANGPVITETINQISCNSVANGSVSVALSGGTPDYNTLWSTGSSANEISGLSAGNYGITVTDAAGCLSIEEYVLTEPLPLSVEPTVLASTCGNTDGSINVLATGGTGTYNYQWSTGSTADNITALSAGEYTLTLTDDNACEIVETYYISDSDAPAITANLVNPTCYEFTNGEIDIALTGGTEPYAYDWSTGSTSQYISGLTAGNYSLSVVDNNGCETYQTYELTEPEALNATATVVDSDCMSANGEISLLVTGGSSSYTYAWSNGATTSTITNLASGLYEVTISDDNACELILPVGVSDSDGPEFTELINPISCFGMNDGNIAITPQTGVAPYTYNWSTGETTAEISNLNAGTYSLLLSDDNACSTAVSFTLDEPESINLDYTLTLPDCNTSNGEILVSVSGGTGSFDYLWDDGATTALREDLNAGDYTVSVSDDSGCEVSETIALSNVNGPNLDADITVPLCYGDENGSIVLTASGGTAPYQFAWNSGETISVISNLMDGDYTVTVNDANNCIRIETYEINQPSQVELTADITGSTCAAPLGIIDLHATGGTNTYNYVWSHGEFTSIVDELPSGEYAVTVSDDSGCEVYDVYELTNENGINVIADITNPSCVGSADGSINLNVSGGTPAYDYAWSTGADQPYVSALAQGLYSVTVSDQGSCSMIYEYEITDPQSIDVFIDVFASTCGNNDGAIDLVLQGGEAPYSYLWSTGETSASINALNSGTYDVTIVDANGCEQTRSIGVYDSNGPELTADIQNAGCSGMFSGSIDITPISGTSPYTYDWSTGSVSSSITGLTAGTYSVEVVDDNNCSTYQEYIITEEAELDIIADVTNSTCGNSDGTIQVTINNGIAPYTYNWDNGDTGSEISGLSSGDYTLTVTDGLGCSKEQIISVSDQNVPDLNEVITHVTCAEGNDGSIELTPTGGTIPYSYNWSTGNTGADITNISAGTYSVSLTDGNNCLIVQDFEITQPDEIQLAANIQASTCAAATGSIDLIATGGNGNYTYNWDSGQTTSAINNLSSGIYEVTVTDAAMCEKIQQFVVTDTDGPEILADITDVSCNADADGIIDLTVNGGNTPYDYQWEHGETTSLISNLAGDNYTVVVTDATNCVSSETYTVIEREDITYMADITQTACNLPNGSIEIESTGGTHSYSYLWDTGSTENQLSDLSPGNYSLTVTDDGGCIMEDIFTINSSTDIELTANISEPACGMSDGNLVLNVNGGIAPYDYLWSNGAETADIDMIASGYYLVTVVDAVGCEQVEQFGVSNSDGPEFDADISHVSEVGGADGYISITPTTGVAPYTYLWSTGSTNSAINNLAIGTYELMLTDDNGCITVQEFEILDPASGVFDVEFIVFEPDCMNANGSIQLNILSGGVAPFNYTWNTGATAATIVNLDAGAYSVTITDSEGTEQIETIILENADGPSLTADLTHVTCFEAANGAIDLSASDGLLPFTYEWNNGETTEDISNLNGGEYEVMVTDANGCVSAGIYQVDEPLEMIVNATLTEPACGTSDGSIAVAVVNGTPGYNYAWNTGDTGNELLNVDAGMYELTVTDANACEYVETIGLSNSDGPELTAEIQDESGESQNDGAILVTATGGALPYSYSWDNGVATALNSGLTAGTYSVEVSDNNNCLSFAEYQVETATELEVIPTLTASDCGASNGEISLEVIGGTMPYHFAWSEGSSSQNLIGVSAGIYEVTVTDAIGTQAIEIIALSDVTGPDLNAVVNNVGCAGFFNGSISLSPSNGDEPYSFDWSTGAVSSEITGLLADTYTVVVTDNSGCVSAEVFELDETPEIEINYTSVEPDCNTSNGELHLAVDGGLAPYNVLWSNGDVGMDLTNIPSGLYEVTITDAQGCDAYFYVPLSDNNGANLNETITHISCNGVSDGSITLNPSDGQMPYVYNWSNGLATASISNLSEGEYAVLVTDDNACNTADVFTINEPDVLEFTPIVTPSECGLAIGAVDLFVSGGNGFYEYTWNTGANESSLTNLSSGIYDVTVNDVGGCVNSTSVIVPDIDGPTVTANITNVSCVGSADGAIALTASDGIDPYSYQWTHGPASESLTGLSGGVYQVAVSDAANCLSAGEYTVVEQSAIDYYADVTPASCGMNNAAIDVLATGGSHAYAYNWSNGATTPDISSLSAGDYDLTISDDLGCSLETSFTIDASDGIELTTTMIEPDCGVANGEIQLNVTNAEEPITYTWSDGATGSLNTNIMAGLYEVTIQDALGCELIESIGLSNADGLTLTEIIIENTCYQSNDASIEITASDGLAPYTYEWLSGQTTNLISDLSAGIYEVMVTDDNDCISFGEYEVTEPEQMQITATITEPDCGALNGEIEVNVMGGTTPYNYAWSNGSPVWAISAVGPGVYDVTVTDDNGCELIESYGLSNADGPQLSADIQHNTCFSSTNGAISVTIESGVAPYTILWDGGETTADIADLTAGTYNIMVTDDNACETYAEYEVTEGNQILSNYILTPPNCGANDGAINLNPSEGVAPYTYQWGTGETTSELSNIPAGIYDVTIADANGCEVEESYTLSEIGGPQLTANIQHNTCFGDAIGAISLTIDSGVAPFDIAWDSGQTTPDIVDLTAGIYNVVVSDDSGCETVASYEVTEGTQVLANATLTEPTCGMNDGSITLNTEGGLAPYTYNWATGETTAELTGISIGTYNVTITDDNACEIYEAILLESTGCDGNYIISGNAMYAGEVTLPSGTTTYATPKYLIDSVEFVLKDIDGNLIASDTTDNTGAFEFSDLSSGVYLLEYNKLYDQLSEWVDGINAADFNLFRTAFLNPTMNNLYFDSIYWDCINVNRDAAWNTVDYNHLRVLYLNAYSEPFLNNPSFFPDGLWNGGQDTIEIENNDVIDHESLLVAFGDYNASSTGFKYKNDFNTYPWDQNGKYHPHNFIFESDEILTLDYNQMDFIIPLKVSSDYYDIAGLNIEFKYPEELFELKSIDIKESSMDQKVNSELNMNIVEFMSKNPDFASTDYNGHIKALYLPNDLSSFNLEKTDTVFYLHFTKSDKNVDISRDFYLYGIENVFAKSDFQEYKNVEFVMPKLVYHTLTDDNDTFGELSIYPNPVKEFINIDMSLIKAGNYIVNIVDVLGRCVLKSQSYELNSGYNKITVPVNNITPGYYVVRIKNLDSFETIDVKIIIE